MTFSSLLKVSFDLIMLIALAAVYCAQPTGIPAHEYIGLAIYLLFIIHIIYNYKWVVNAGKKFFDKTISAKIKFMYAVDWLLLIAFILIGFSGIMISHVIFKFEKMPLWRPMHTIASAVSIILLAVHVGLHFNMIVNTVKTKLKVPFVITKTTALIIFALLLFIGIYGDVASKTQPSQNQITGRPKYETTIALFERSFNLLSGPPEYVRNREAPSNQTEGSNPRRGAPPQSFNMNGLLISVSNYIAFILLCSVIVFLLMRCFTGFVKTKPAD